ncbi:MAG: pyridoxine 5'-phosphate synthase [Polyangiaceae bacterium]
MLAIALDVRPDVVTLVPERREERTTEGGGLMWWVTEVTSGGTRIVGALRAAKIKVSLFLAPDLAQNSYGCCALGRSSRAAHRQYCHRNGKAREDELGRLETAARAIHAANIAVAAGHGLTRNNVGPVAGCPSSKSSTSGARSSRTRCSWACPRRSKPCETPWIVVLQTARKPGNETDFVARADPAV